MSKLDQILYDAIDSENTAKAKKALKSFMLELVGQDQTVSEEADGEVYGSQVGRNKLRAELRAKIEAL